MRYKEMFGLIIFPLIIGLMISTTSVIARQDGFAEWICIGFIYIGLLVSLIGIWNLLMSFTFEKYILWFGKLDSENKQNKEVKENGK